MQFHHHGYVSGDPRVQRAAGTGLKRPAEMPAEVDVLIVGTGPAGVVAAAQLAQFPSVTTRIVERRSGRLEIGQADGIQARSVETFQAFGFAERIAAEAYRITEMAFWKPDADDPARIVRTAVPPDDPGGISEFPHLIVNQARVLDYFIEFMGDSPARLAPDYGLEVSELTVSDDDDHPVHVTLQHTAGPKAGQQQLVRARYVVGADGARSRVRSAIGCTLAGDQAFHAWGVIDALAVTDFPDIRTKCSIKAAAGTILLIPREGGHLFRMYVDLGEVAEDNQGSVRQTSVDEIVARACAIFFPYTLEVRHVAWHSVYEVGHRLSDRFDDVPLDQLGERSPRVFIAGDACHTHSAKAGQGMNVSMQDGFNLGWKLGHVLTGRSPELLLATYSQERQVVAKNLIDFDREWSSMMATKPEDMDPTALEDFYVATAEFPAGFMTQYAPSVIVGDHRYQERAGGFPVGRRFKSAVVDRVADGNPIHLGHQHRADGRWRIYAFADGAPGPTSAADALADWLVTGADSPVMVHTPADGDRDALLDIKVIYPGSHLAIDLAQVPEVFRPRVGPFRLIDNEKVYAAGAADIFAARQVAADGAVVVVRPDQYVAAVLPLTATEELAQFFRGCLRPADPRLDTDPHQ